MASVPVFLWLSCLFSSFLSSVHAQTVSLDTPVPPLQWINLTPLLQGPSPPPLRDAALGYDEDSRSLVIFGGESEGGFVQSRTYILNLNALTWSTPSPPFNLRTTPAARSSAISGLDFAASNRHAFVVIGGRGAGDVALSDVWAFDFTNQFWSQVSLSPGGPEPRWGASGGLDTRIEPIQDQLLPGPNNTFYLAGGANSQRIFPQSDVWQLNISGILSANLPSNVLGSWHRINFDDSLPAIAQQGGAILGQRIVSTGGCNSSIERDDSDPSCAQQASYVIDASRRAFISPSPCPPPRIDPVLVANMNGFSSRFTSQVFLALGTVNTTLWNDDGGIEKGEIDVLDVNTGSWSRVLPAGDPESSGHVSFPSAREGASAFSYGRGLVGSARDGKSDTIVFGGRDASGKYLSEVWLLRSYSGALSPSSTSWSGYDNGILRSGIDASGSGVTTRFLDHCATIRPPTNPGGTEEPSAPIPTPRHGYDASLSHKLLSPLSIGLLFLSTLLLRTFTLSFSGPNLLRLRSAFLFLFAIGSYTIGIIGFVFAFTSSLVSSLDSQQSGFSLPHLSTPHGIASLVFFILLYGVTPALLLLSIFAPRTHRPPSDTNSQASALRNTSPSLVEKPDPVQRSSSHSPSPSVLYSPSLSPRPHSATWGQSTSPNPVRRSLDAFSLDGESAISGTPGSPRRAFEVLNRPSRVRKQSETWSTSFGHSSPPPLPSTRSLGEIDWLLRRRSLNAVGELDYALSVAHNAQRASVTTSEPLQLRAVPRLDTTQRPSALDICIFTCTQIGFLGLNVVALAALWRYAPKAAFIVYLVLVVVIYACFFLSPRRFKAEDYILSRLHPRGPSKQVAPSDPAVVASNSVESTDQTTPPGPYLHPPPFLRTVPADAVYAADEPRSLEGDDDEELDDDTRQRMIEEEMDRREVSIVTVPKRKLWVANPS